jgi:hypothetical protein
MFSSPSDIRKKEKENSKKIHAMFSGYETRIGHSANLLTLPVGRSGFFLAATGVTSKPTETAANWVFMMGAVLTAGLADFLSGSGSFKARTGLLLDGC